MGGLDFSLAPNSYLGRMGSGVAATGILSTTENVLLTNNSSTITVLEVLRACK